MKILLPFLLIIALCSISSAQQSPDDLPIIGKVADIQSFKKVYLVTDSTEDRKMILLAFKKKKAKFEVVGDPQQAEFFLQYKQVSSKDTTGLTGRGQYNELGEMTAYYFNADKKKIVAWSESKNYYESAGFSVESPNSYVLARKFVNAFTGKKD